MVEEERERPWRGPFRRSEENPTKKGEIGDGTIDAMGAASSRPQKFLRVFTFPK